MHNDFLIIGAGIIGLAIARELKRVKPNVSITIIDKESTSIEHGSGRNSGVIHAGFYYPHDSLKAKFTRDGNQELTQYCLTNNLKLNQCGKLVVAQNEQEIAGLYELQRRAKLNKVTVELIDQHQALAIEPNVRTHQFALFSPTTSSADPKEVTGHLASSLIKAGVVIDYQTSYQKRLSDQAVLCLDIKRQKKKTVQAHYIINTAGLYADKIAKDYGFCQNYVIIPFKGIYLKYTKPNIPIRTHIYPVPNLNNPFLGVHFTLTVNNEVKIGPTAIPALWRENYQGFDNFKLDEFLEVMAYEAKLFINNSFGFRKLAIEEVKKYRRRHFVKLAANLVNQLDESGFNQWSKPGIRAQLLNRDTMELLQDFVIESDHQSLHVLNAVSPAWTSSFPFARYIVSHYLAKIL